MANERFSETKEIIFDINEDLKSEYITSPIGVMRIFEERIKEEMRLDLFQKINKLPAYIALHSEITELIRNAAGAGATQLKIIFELSHDSLIIKIIDNAPKIDNQKLIEYGRTGTNQDSKGEGIALKQIKTYLEFAEHKSEFKILTNEEDHAYLQFKSNNLEVKGGSFNETVKAAQELSSLKKLSLKELSPSGELSPEMLSPQEITAASSPPKLNLFGRGGPREKLLKKRASSNNNENIAPKEETGSRDKFKKS
jgi:hypothetical protein